MVRLSEPVGDGAHFPTREKPSGRVGLEYGLKRYGRLLLAATALSASSAAWAQSAEQASTREAALEARLAAMENELRTLRAEMAQVRSAPPPPSVVATANAAQNSATAAVAPAAANTPVSNVAAGASGTSVTLGGYIKLVATNSRFSEGEVATNSLGRDFYLPQTIPTGNGPASRVQDFSAKQTRLWLNLATNIAGHNVRGYLETDFQTAAGTQGTQRTTNGYNLALRRAYIQVDRFTLGQDWSTFQYVAALPETTDFVGTTEGTVFSRQPLIRYSAPLGHGLTLHASVENAEAATSTTGSPALIENGDDAMPDFAARLAYTGRIGELSLAGLARDVRVQNARVVARNFGWGVSAAGKINLAQPGGPDFRFMATYGANIGRYVGVNFAPDSVLVAGTNELEDVRIFAGFAALRLPLSPQLRVNLMGGYQSVDYADALSPLAIAGYNRRAWSAAANIFWSPVRNVDLGFEIRHAERTLVNGDNGALDRLEFAAKYSF